MADTTSGDGFISVTGAKRGGANQASRGRGRGGPPRARVPKPVVQPALGPGDSLGAGDSTIVLDILKDFTVDGQNLADVAFERMRDEVKWGVMKHRGGEVPRRVAVEGDVQGDGSFPIYRHPSDESPPLLQFSPTVALIRDAVQKVLKHPVNHVLIQHYRSGSDHISEHSDKTIDVVRGSSIVNVSLGAQRTMTLRLKRDGAAAAATQKATAASLKIAANPPTTPDTVLPPPRTQQRIPLPHGSMFVMGPQTNAQWLHGISQDKRPASKIQNSSTGEPDARYKTPAELAYGEERISLTFRHIGTFLTKDPSNAAGVVGNGIAEEEEGTGEMNANVQRIWGQGARAKTRERAGPVVSDGRQGSQLIWAFGRENSESVFDWDRWYGEGFDVLHFNREA